MAFWGINKGTVVVSVSKSPLEMTPLAHAHAAGHFPDKRMLWKLLHMTCSTYTASPVMIRYNTGTGIRNFFCNESSVYLSTAALSVWPLEATGVRIRALPRSFYVVCVEPHRAYQFLDNKLDCNMVQATCVEDRWYNMCSTARIFKVKRKYVHCT